MFKTITSYSKKVPTNENQYEMIEFSVSMEREISESLSCEERQRLRRDDYKELKEDVQNQIDGYRKNVSTPQQAAPQTQTAASAQTAAPVNNSKPASDKQIALIQLLATKQGLTDKQVTQQLSQAFGTPELEPLSKTLEKLTSKQASEYIESLNKGKQAQTQAPQQQTPHRANNGHSNNGKKKYAASPNKPISPKQMQMIQTMADERDYTYQQMNNKLVKEYGVSGVEQLNSKQASILIESFPRKERTG